MTRAYRSKVRDEQAAATRERILDAAHELLQTTRPVDLSWADVARVAGTSTRTVYRHFPEPQALFLALSDRLLAAVVPEGLPTALGPALELVRRQFATLEEDPALFRLFFAVPTLSRYDQAGLYRGILGSKLAGVPEEQHRALFGVVDLLGSPYAWDVLHANWGLDARRASRAVEVAMRALLDHLAEHPTALDPDGPPPFAEESP